MVHQFQASGPFWRITPGRAMAQLPTMFTTATTKFRENLHAVHAQHLGQLANKARANFYSDIKRPAETGEGKGGRRETGNFTFGGSGSAFVGRLIEEGDKIGFGWPDVDQADRSTNFVWRSLEFGLAGHTAGPSARFSELAPYMPIGHHKLPRAFWFTSGDPGSSRLVVGKFGYRQASQRFGRGQQTWGRGIEGKHFLERAWFETAIGNPNKYRPVVQKSFIAFR